MTLENSIAASEKSANPSVMDQLTHLFAHKAEWLSQEIYDLFQQPGYLPELKLNQSCVLIGGRGTGKTTVLRGMSYEGQYHLNQKSPDEWDFYGIYYKVDSNSISALGGLDLSEKEWQRPFAHYFNLIISSLVLKMVDWYQKLPSHNPLVLEASAWAPFRESFSLNISEKQDDILSLDNLRKQLAIAVTQFEVYINNIQDPDIAKPKLSLLGSPLDKLQDALDTLAPFKNKHLYILLDEYENFADYQQRIVNTLIKQSAGRNYCFKVGVRELGWRVKHTLNGQELQAPNDFRRILISEHLSGKKFRNFAETICNKRLNKLKLDTVGRITVKHLLPGLTDLKEAELLGIKQLSSKILSNIKGEVSNTEYDLLCAQPAELIWFAHEWGVRKKKSPVQSLQALLSDSTMWKKRLENYLHAILFSVRAGKSGLRKYYTGWDTYVLMANGNIRFLLQLVEAALREQSGPTDKSLHVVSPENQTLAAIKIGSNNLNELEGVDVKGRKIMRLVQGLGRVFQIFAENPFGRAPEINQFYVPELNGELTGPNSDVNEAQEVLESGLSYLALQRAPSNKLGKESSKGYDYFVHPIFSAFFRFSHRKKRKTTLHASDIVGLISNQTKTSDAIISRARNAKSITPPVKEVPTKTGKHNKPSKDGLEGQFSLFTNSEE